MRTTFIATWFVISSAMYSSAMACEEAAYRQFDFWLGQWEVHTRDGTLAGRNTIEQAESGCLLIENWQSANGGTGQSYNFYSPGTKSWRQVWVSQGAIIDYSGGWREGAMQLEGEITYQASGQQFPFRGAWTPKNGDVEQKLEQWNPETDRWDDWFTGVYRKKNKEHNTE